MGQEASYEMMGLYPPVSSSDILVAPVPMRHVIAAEVKSMIADVVSVTRSIQEDEAEIRKLDKRKEILMEEGSKQSTTRPLRMRDRPQPDRTERMSALSILPKEVWKMILDNVSDPDDLWNLSNTCQLFEDLLGDFLFSRFLDQHLQHLTPHLSGRDIRTLGLVSKNSKKSVENFLENHPSMRPYDHQRGQKDHRLLDFISPLKEKHLYRYNCVTFSNSNTSANSARIRNFLSFSPGGTCPFIGRCIGIKMGRERLSQVLDQVGDKWWDDLASFCEKLGKEIWYLGLILPENPSQELKPKLELFIKTSLLSAMPNLRSISIDFRNHHLCIDHPAPFPVLEHLESVRFVNYPYVDFLGSHILLDFLKCNPGQLCLDFCNYFHHSLAYTPLNGLKDLTLKLGRGNCAVSRALMLMPTDLGRAFTKLTLIFPTPPQHCLFDELLDMLNKMKARTSLCTLRLSGDLAGLRFTEGDEDTEMGVGYLTNPCSSTIQTLEIDLDWVIVTYPLHVNFNFLLPCFPDLENLILFARATHGQEQPDFGFEVDLLSKERFVEWAETVWSRMNEDEEFIEIHKYLHTGEMYKSNIWEILPRLKVITVQYDVFTRKGYEAYKMRNA